MNDDDDDDDDDDDELLLFADLREGRIRVGLFEVEGCIEEEDDEEVETVSVF